MAPPDPEDLPTALLPSAAPPARPSFLRKWLPWAGFALVAVVVVAATTAWATTLRPAADDALLSGAANAAVPVTTSEAPPAVTTTPERARLPAGAPAAAAPVSQQHVQQPAPMVTPPAAGPSPLPEATTPPVGLPSPPPAATTTPRFTLRNQPACNPGIAREQVLPGCVTSTPAAARTAAAPAPGY